MAKIVLVVGEHKNEILSQVRAKQVKPLLEGMGHDVKIVPAGMGLSMVQHARVLGSCPQGKVKEIIEDLLSNPRLDGSRKITMHHARQNPLAHVFNMHSFHAESVPNHESEAVLWDGTGLGTGLDFEQEGAKRKDFSARIGLGNHAATILYWRHQERGKKTRIVAEVESSAVSREFGRQEVHKKAVERALAWGRSPTGAAFMRRKFTADSGVPEEALNQVAVQHAEAASQHLAYRLWNYGSVFSEPKEPRETSAKRAQSLAQKIHELVSSAEKETFLTRLGSKFGRKR